VPPPPVSTGPTQKKASTTGSSNTSKEKKKDRNKRISARRVNDREKERSASPQEIPIDPDEPTYCLCDQVRVSRDTKLVAKCKINLCFV
jgi:hypothetical protein